MKRRDFLKVLGVTGAGAATAGCSTGEVERLIPYVIPPEEIVPGVPTWYTSTCRECPAGCGIHVETHSGRATKVEGNPDHPISRGNLCARGQASVQGLYHPDRYRGPFTREHGVETTDVTWTVATQLVSRRIQELGQAGQGGQVVLLTGDYTGTMDRLANEFVAAIGGRRVVYEPFADQPRGLDFADADVLISFGADFLETWGSPVDYSYQFGQFRTYRDGRRGKFVWVAPHRPLTGINADQWIAPKPGTEAILAAALSGGVDVASAAQATGVDASVIEGLLGEMRGRRVVALGPGASYASRDTRALRDAVNRINAGGGTAAPGRGGATRDVLALVEEMRQGAVSMVIIDGRINPAYSLPGAARFAEALERVPMKVSLATFPDETSLLCDLVLPDHHFLEEWSDYVPQPGVNLLVQPSMRPLYNTRQAGDTLLAVARNLGAAGITASTYYDYLRANWSGLAAGEGWNEAVKRGGVWPGLAGRAGAAGAAAQTVSAGQPVVAGAGTTDQTAQELAAAADTSAVGAGQAAPGQAPGTAPAPAVVAAPVATAPAPRAQAPVAGGPARLAPVEFQGARDAAFHLVVYPSYRFFDGRTANRPWLLELPDPVTKVSWDSWVEVHPAAAREMGVEQGALVDVASQYGSLTLPVFVYPGVRPDTVAIQMGLGHKAFGRYTENIGQNPNVLLGPDVDAFDGESARYGLRVSVRPAAEKIAGYDGIFEYGVRIQHERELAQAISVAEMAALEQSGAQPKIPGEDQVIETLRGYGGFVPEASTTDPAGGYPPPGTHYGEYIEGATRWAMTIDLSRCIGCSACVTACYAENNIPVVGPKELRRGREMAWLRIERYFGVTRHEEEAYEDGATDDVRFLPMLCQHCGNAPCEPVCPVYAAYHTPDGLNGQVYNRCVGTRYCANNCPYKVRVFNWFTWDFVEPLNWQLNPDVVTREKGVMEKCTFCVQRIREGERKAQLENRAVADGEIVPACVQTCPTEVFTFGNIADPNSQVAQTARSIRGYRALDLLNTQPAIVYLKKVTLHEPARGGHHAPAAGHEPAGAASH